MTSLLQKINTLDTKVDGLDSSNLQTQITTNTNDISTLQTSKQNILTAGDNITITGDTISSTGGSGTTIDSTTDISCNTLTTVGDIDCGGNLSTPNRISFYSNQNIGFVATLELNGSTIAKAQRNPGYTSSYTQYQISATAYCSDGDVVRPITIANSIRIQLSNDTIFFGFFIG